MDLKVGVGVGKEKDSYKAGKAAAEQALKQLKAKKPDVLIVLGAPRFDHNRLLKGITSVTGKTKMVGGTTAGEISTEGFSTNSVVVMAIKSNDILFSAGLGRNIRKSEIKAGQQVAKEVLKKMPKNKAKSLIIFTDSMAGDGLQIVKGIQSVLGEEFEIVGGALGDEDKFKKTYQYYNGKVYTNTVPGLLVGGNINTSTGVMSGWKSIGNRFCCTSSKSNVVYTFDKKRAFDFYESLLGKERAKKLPAIGLEYPLGMIDEKAKIRGKEYFQIRCPLAVDKKKGTVTLAASIPEGKSVTLTSASRSDVIEGSRLAAEQAKKTLGKHKPRLILMFSCIARKMVLGIRTQEEVDAVKNVLGKDVPMIGFYTYGEIGPIDKNVKELKATRWHNETAVLWVLGD